jgi:Rod binding domain-containing protein
MGGGVDPVLLLDAAARGGRAPDPKVVAREFEALLLGEMMKTAAKPLGVSDVLGGGSAGRMYQEMFLQEVARLAAARGGLGLAATLGARLQSEGPPAEGGGSGGDGR